MEAIRKINYIQMLLDKGAILEDYQTSKERPKVQGYMWGGRAKLTYKELTFHFELWHHGSDHETPVSLQEHFSLRGLGFGNKYYDVGWYCIFATDGIYVHHTGWFRDQELRNHPLIKVLPNHHGYDVILTDSEKAVITALGFKRVVAI